MAFERCESVCFMVAPDAYVKPQFRRKTSYCGNACDEFNRFRGDGAFVRLKRVV